MRITVKFTLIIATLLITLFMALGWNTYQHELTLIQQQAVENARVIARQIVETREYLTHGENGESEKNYALVPQVAASQIADRITKDSPYYVRQVSLRNRNPNNSPDSYEAAELRRFASEPEAKESFLVINEKGQESLRYMLPLLTEKQCLLCHGSYESAPRFVQERFPKGHPSYNYKPGEPIGAISVSVPMRALYQTIHSNLIHALSIESIILILLLALTGWAIHRTILQPVSNVARGIESVASSGNYAQRISHDSRDEIGHLVASFNELLAELERRTLQRTESDERYRNFIEIAQSPIVTFMADGKIVIANQKAERLFGLSKEELLGQSIYDFIVEPGPIRKGITDYFQAGNSTLLGTTSRQMVRDLCGQQMEVEMVISVSQSYQDALFTAILRTIKN